MSVISNKLITHYDEMLFSGSSEPLRTNFGLYFEVVQSSGSVNKNLFNPIITIDDGASPFEVNDHNAYALDNAYTDKLIYIQSNLDLQTTASSNSVVSTVKFPVRII